MIINNTRIDNFIEALYYEIYDEIYDMVEESERTRKSLDLVSIKKKLDRQLESVINTLDIINEATRDWAKENGKEPDII